MTLWHSYLPKLYIVSDLVVWICDFRCNWEVVVRIRKANCGGCSDLEGMTSRLFNQPIPKHCILTTSLNTGTASFRHSKRYLHSISTLRTITVSLKPKLEHSQFRAQSKVSRSFPEAMDAIKQTVAQNLGIGVCTCASILWALKPWKPTAVIFPTLVSLPDYVPWRRRADTELCLGGSWTGSRKPAIQPWRYAQSQGESCRHHWWLGRYWLRSQSHTPLPRHREALHPLSIERGGRWLDQSYQGRDGRGDS